MRTPWPSDRCLRDAIAEGDSSPSGYFFTAAHRTAFRDLLQASAIPSSVDQLGGRSVLIAMADPYLAALALIELDGLARRMVLCPPDLALEHLPYVIRHANVDAIVSDGSFLSRVEINTARHVVCSPTLVPRIPADSRRLPTEWVLLTSGTTGRPKMVQHSLASLAGAISPDQGCDKAIWSTFYDIRRYGGLQIFLRAVLTHSSLMLPAPHEPVGNFLLRAAETGVTHISGTPSHWRRALMSPLASQLSPTYIRLSGEISDQAILNSLETAWPTARISHAFASTEAGVAFDVRDGQPGFPASYLNNTPHVELKVVEGTLRIRSARTAQRYLGENPPVLKDADGFVDTGDELALRDGRYYFQGRRDGVINVGGMKVYPEEVEAVINRHPQVQSSLVKTKKNPITGALVVAEVLLKVLETPDSEHALELMQEITQFCRASLEPHKVPAAIRFVPMLAVSETGKLVRRDA